MKERMEYYLGRKVTQAEVEEAEEWQEDHPESDLAEYVEQMIAIGAL